MKRKVFFSLFFIIMFFFPITQLNSQNLSSADNFSPLLGFGFNSRTGKSNSVASLWFNAATVKTNTRGEEIGGAQYSKLVKNISEVLEVTESSINVSLKKGLFSGSGDFSNQCKATLNKRSITYYITATRFQRFVMTNIGETFTEKTKNQMRIIEDNLYGENPNLDKAKKAYKRLSDTIGPEYTSEVFKRIYLGLRYSFTASSEGHLKDLKAKLNANYGGVSTTAAFSYLRSQQEKNLSYDVKIVGDGITDPVFQNIDYWNSNIKAIQEACLNGIKDASMENAPVVSYLTVPLWQILGFGSELGETTYESWLNIENQRNKMLKELFEESLYLSNNEITLEDLFREQAIPLKIRKKMEAEIYKFRKKTSEITRFAQKVNSIDDINELNDISENRPSTPNSIDFKSILPEVRIDLVRVNSFTGKVSCGAQTVYRNNWDGSLRLGFNISSELKTLINTISLYRIPENDTERLIYHGPFVDSWRQSDAILYRGHLPFGDDQPKAISAHTEYFKSKDKNTKYQLRLFWIDGKEETIELPKWTAI